MENVKGFDQFVRRYFYGENIKKIDNNGLHAGSPYYYYCIHCGVPTEAFPEPPVAQPNEICSQCKDLDNSGLLEKAKEILKKHNSST